MKFEKLFSGKLAFMCFCWLSILIFYFAFQDSPGSISRQALGIKNDPLWWGVSYQEENGKEVICFSDFSAHLNACRQIWEKNVERPYTGEGHRDFYKNWAGLKLQPNSVGGFPYSPVGVFFSRAITHLEGLNGYLLYAFTGLILLTVFLYVIDRKIREASFQEFSGQYFFLISLFLLVLFSGQLWYAIRHTPLWTVPLLGLGCLLLFRVSALADIAIGMVLCLLASKPPMAVLFGICCLGFRRYRSIGIGAGLTLLVIGLTAFWLPSMRVGGWGDYVAFIQSYHHDAADPFIRYGISYPYQTNLASVLILNLSIQLHYFGSKALMVTCELAWVFLAVAVFFVLRKKIQEGSLSAMRSFIALEFIIFLIFTPHLLRYEDLHLMIPLFFMGSLISASSVIKGIVIASVLIVFQVCPILNMLDYGGYPWWRLENGTCLYFQALPSLLLKFMLLFLELRWVIVYLIREERPVRTYKFDSNLA